MCTKAPGKTKAKHTFKPVILLMTKAPDLAKNICFHPSLEISKLEKENSFFCDTNTNNIIIIMLLGIRLIYD